jgi:hypothetical protein
VRPADRADFEAIVAAVFRRARVDLEERFGEDEEIVSEILGAVEIATVGIEFPESMHSDAIWVSISRFPGGTSVGPKHSTWDGGEIAFVADWNMYDKDEEPTEDGLPGMLFGFDQLIRASRSQDRENLFYGRAAACRKYRPRGNSEVVEIREAPSNVLG